MCTPSTAEWYGAGGQYGKRILINHNMRRLLHEAGVPDHIIDLYHHFKEHTARFGMTARFFAECHRKGLRQVQRLFEQARSFGVMEMIRCGGNRVFYRMVIPEWLCDLLQRSKNEHCATPVSRNINSLCMNGT